MKINEIIKKRQAGTQLSKDELFFVVEGFTTGKINKKQMTDFLQTVVKKDLSKKETFHFTTAMINSGIKYDLSMFEKTIDKHSTGGVSDSTTFIVLPLFVLFGWTCVKMSGGSLGHTGGTADKILQFEGINITPNRNEILSLAKENGGCFITSSKQIAPADKKIYALRDEIGAMSIGLIASSIMSKKIASGNKRLVLDVKFGNGALLQKKTDAKRLAKLMVKIGKKHGVETTYVLGDMNQPLGKYIGNGCEVKEVLELLSNPKPTRLIEHSLNLVAIALCKPMKTSKRKIKKLCWKMLEDGKVLEKFEQIIKAQGGEFDIKKFDFVPKNIVKSNKSGIINWIDTKKLGFLDRQLSKTASDYKGFKILKELGEQVEDNEPIFEFFFENDNFKEIENEFLETIRTKK